MSLLRATFADDAPGHHGGHDRDGRIDEQRPAPRGELREHAAEDEPDCGTTAGDRSVDTKGPSSLVGLGEGNGQNRQSGGRHYGGEAALERTRREQHGLVLGQPAERRREAESDESNDEHPATTHVVRHPTSEQEKTAKDQGVRTHDPLTVRDRNVQGVLG